MNQRQETQLCKDIDRECTKKMASLNHQRTKVDGLWKWYPNHYRDTEAVKELKQMYCERMDEYVSDRILGGHILMTDKAIASRLYTPSDLSGHMVTHGNLKEWFDLHKCTEIADEMDKAVDALKAREDAKAEELWDYCENLKSQVIRGKDCDDIVKLINVFNEESTSIIL